MNQRPCQITGCFFSFDGSQSKHMKTDKKNDDCVDDGKHNHDIFMHFQQSTKKNGDDSLFLALGEIWVIILKFRSMEFI